MTRVYSLRKSHHILHWSYSFFKKKGQSLPPQQLIHMESDLRALEDSIFNKDRIKADELARKLEGFTHTKFKRSFWEYALEIGVAIIFALIVATIVRQAWFEFYQIPTGSMRPSFREEDHLSVTKTPFGINVPLQAKHFLFDPDLVKRGNIVIFSGENIPGMDVDTTYFWVFPYKKRYIKRLIGKPGDSLYFYGGKIYGIDKEGQPIKELLNDPWMQKIEHIPFISFEGTIRDIGNNRIDLIHFGKPFGRLHFRRLGEGKTEVFNGKEWVEDNPFSRDKNHIHSYGNLWGINNFAIAKLLTKEEVERTTDIDMKEIEEGVLYLYLRHHPNLTTPSPRIYPSRYQEHGARIPGLETVIPLQQHHLETIAKHMYTSRFLVDRGRAFQYNVEGGLLPRQGVAGFENVPDGTYDIYQGKAEKVGLKGWTTTLPTTHPLYNQNPKWVQALFNYGIGFYPHPEVPTRRYAYFREGSLYLMGAPVLEKEDPTLKTFLDREKNREDHSKKTYIAFKDNGPPIKDGQWDIEKIKTFGIKVPEKHYLVLGDNHANSSDSRVFGFVPEDNLQGAPSLLMWPPGERWGAPPQSGYQLITLPRVIVWTIALIILVGWYIYHRQKMTKRLFPMDHKRVS